VDDLAALLDELNLARVFLVGQSMGGGTCAAFTCRSPERVRALVHVDSLAGVSLPPPYGDELEEIHAATAGLSQAERVLGPTIRENDPERTFLYLQIASFNSVALKTVKGEPERWTPAQLAAAGAPVMFVVGERDIICPPRLVRAMHEGVPHSRFEIIPNAGHSAYFEAPQAFNARLVAFLDGFAESA
jgi:pimeloyl-ACP methyl ester carboxylesterase